MKNINLDLEGYICDRWDSALEASDSNLALMSDISDFIFDPRASDSTLDFMSDISDLILDSSDLILDFKSDFAEDTLDLTDDFLEDADDFLEDVAESDVRTVGFLPPSELLKYN